MRWEERQERVVAVVEDCIDEISEEFDLKVPYYPEIYWIGNTICFDELLLPEVYRKELVDDSDDFGQNLNGNSLFLRTQEIILVNEYTQYACSEEASHFLHHVNSTDVRGNLIKNDVVFLRIMEEMMGFFGSQIVCRDRPNEYGHGRRKDLFDLSRRTAINNLSENINFYIYQQGYGLGERLFCSYLNGNVSKKEVHDLFSLNLREEKNVATANFLYWRQKLWPINMDNFYNLFFE